MRRVLFLTLVFIIAISSIHAAVPTTINYQGRLTDAEGSPVDNGAQFVTFKIYDAAIGGAPLWNSGIQGVTTVAWPSGLFLKLP